jgi:hypothetical protein
MNTTKASISDLYVWAKKRIWNQLLSHFSKDCDMKTFQKG